MPVNFTSLRFDEIANDTTFNAPLTELDNAIEGVRDGTGTLASPAISSFTNSAHDHSNAAGGGQIDLGALDGSAGSAGQVPLNDGSGGVEWGQGVAVPTGGIIEWGGSSLPSGGWRYCDGAAVSRQTFAALFAAIGTNHGSGNGSTTFNVPDKRGRAGIGMDNMGTSAGAANRVTDSNADTIGGSGGAENHTLTEAQMPEHHHGILYGGDAAAGSNPGEDVLYTGGGRNTLNSSSQINRNLYARYALSPDDAGTVDAYTDNGGMPLTNQGAAEGDAHNNMQPWLASPYIIKT